MSGDYRLRRAECERAAAALGVALLSDLAEADLPRINRLPEPLNRRARHVVTENARVLAAMTAMRANALDELGALWTASHASMRDDYDVSIPDIDQIVETALASPNVYGARLTGGGFGGSVIVLTNAGSERSVALAIQETYGTQTGKSVRVLLPGLRNPR